MTIKYCPYCNKIGKTRVLSDYEQVPWRGIMVKRRRVMHLIDDGGCGHTWYTVELPFEMLPDEDENDSEQGHAGIEPVGLHSE